MNLIERHDRAIQRIQGALEALLDPVAHEALSFISAEDWEGLARWAQRRSGRRRREEARPPERRIVYDVELVGRDPFD